MIEEKDLLLVEEKDHLRLEEKGLLLPDEKDRLWREEIYLLSKIVEGIPEAIIEDDPGLRSRDTGDLETGEEIQTLRIIDSCTNQTKEEKISFNIMFAFFAVNMEILMN